VNSKSWNNIYANHSFCEAALMKEETLVLLAAKENLLNAVQDGH
jgi:hypothetical protein